MFCGARINLIQINAGGFASGGKADIAGSPSWANRRRCTVDAPLTKTSSICLAIKAPS